MLIPKFKTTCMSKDVTLPEVWLRDEHVPLYLSAMKSTTLPDKVMLGRGLCYAVTADMDTNGNPCIDFYASVGDALDSAGFLYTYVRRQWGVTYYEVPLIPDMDALRLAWAAHMVKHMERRQ